MLYEQVPYSVIDEARITDIHHLNTVICASETHEADILLFKSLYGLSTEQLVECLEAAYESVYQSGIYYVLVTNRVNERLDEQVLAMFPHLYPEE